MGFQNYPNHSRSTDSHLRLLRHHQLRRLHPRVPLLQYLRVLLATHGRVMHLCPHAVQVRPTRRRAAHVRTSSLPRRQRRRPRRGLPAVVGCQENSRVCVPPPDKTASPAARILVERCLSFFPNPAFLVSDGGTHFKCKLFEKIVEIHGF